MLLTLTTLTLALDPAALTARLKAIAADRGDHYKCKIGIGVQSSTLSLAATSDGDVDERFVWGSVTKLLTGSGILRQVEKGNLKLDGPAAPHIDPVLSALGLGTMVELFGEEAAKISAHHLGAMQSGVGSPSSVRMPTSSGGSFQCSLSPSGHGHARSPGLSGKGEQRLPSAASSEATTISCKDGDSTMSEVPLSIMAGSPSAPRSGQVSS